MKNEFFWSKHGPWAKKNEKKKNLWSSNLERFNSSSWVETEDKKQTALSTPTSAMARRLSRTLVVMVYEMTNKQDAAAMIRARTTISLMWRKRGVVGDDDPYGDHSGQERWRVERNHGTANLHVQVFF